MISDEELLLFGQRGFIPGPQEDEKIFLERVNFSQKPLKKCFAEFGEKPPFPIDNKVEEQDWSWASVQLKHFYDVNPSWAPTFYHKRKLLPWQAGMTWIIELEGGKKKFTLIQLRKKSIFCSKDELLAHEGAHVARSAYNEPKFEEFFAYFLSSNKFRKLFGPIVQKPYEAVIFIFFILSGFWGELLFSSPLLFACLKTCALIWLSLGLFRLARYRFVFNRTYKKVSSSITDSKKALAVLFRLTDDEIFYFNSLNANEIREYASRQKKGSLRWRMIFLAYYKNRENIS